MRLADHFRVRRTALRTCHALLAMFAAIMLVIGGAPAMAAAGLCNPCPPDCAMMQPSAVADQHGKSPLQQNQGDVPCKSGVACQTAMALPVLPEGTMLAWAAPRSGGHVIRIDRMAPSRPPDRALRPPIQL